jgi:hypothetical protein
VSGHDPYDGIIIRPTSLKVPSVQIRKKQKGESKTED